jgi:hypothetical protein
MSGKPISEYDEFTGIFDGLDIESVAVETLGESELIKRVVDLTLASSIHDEEVRSACVDGAAEFFNIDPQLLEIVFKQAEERQGYYYGKA